MIVRVLGEGQFEVDDELAKMKSQLEGGAAPKELEGEETK